MNREWHEQHRMPSRATEDERIQWHLAHAENCACRPVPPGLLARLSEDERRPIVGMARQPEKL
jgi:hypothetical protein